jgi:rSAM/selenodomain-associated transferase 2
VPLQRDDAGGVVISVIIPTLNEAETLAALLGDLRRDDAALEIIVADAGSSDGTSAIAASCGARLIRCAEPSRGAQLAQGVAQSTGDVLLFLHADCRFPSGGLAAIERALARAPNASGGNFRLLFDGDTPFSRWLIRFYAFIRALGLYYGDSGIFVRRSVYERIGGIRPIALMEDFDFVRRLERAGRTLCIDAPPLLTSSRRFAGRAAPAIVAGWLWLHALYLIGVSPDRLARLYDSGRSR